jgi:hypothetical protein
VRYSVVFTRKLHFVARMIMWFTKSGISHVMIRQKGYGADYALEAVHPKIRVQWYDVVLRNKATVITELEVVWPEEKLEAAWRKACYERLDLKYGWKTMIGDAYVYIRYWLTGKKAKNPFPAPWQDVCSELTLTFLLEAGIPGLEGLDRVFVAPSDPNPDNPGLLQVMLKHPDVFKELSPASQDS